MNVFCEHCSWENHVNGTNNPEIVEVKDVIKEKTVTKFIDGVATVEEIECYVCPEGHSICKSWADFVDPAQIKAGAQCARSCVDMVCNIMEM